MKKLLLAASAAAMAAFGLMACGDEVTNINNQVGIQQVAAGDTLGKCSDKNAGEMVFVTDSAAVYYCAGDEWLPLNGKDGVDGKDGADGKDGEKGEKGDKGEDGVKGEKGDQSEGCTAEAFADSTDSLKTGYKITCGDDSNIVWNGSEGSAGTDCIAADLGDGRVVLKCGEGEGITLYKAMCGVKSYDPEGLFFCVDGVLHEKCGTAVYDINDEFCEGGVVYKKDEYGLCGSVLYAKSEKICSADLLYDREYYDVCGNQLYRFKDAEDFTIASCEGDVVTGVCQNANPSSYDISTHFCWNHGKILELCGTSTYDPVSQKCEGGVLSGKPTCGEEYYDASKQFCESEVLYDFCGGKSYSPATQFCDGGAVYNKCGSAVFNPGTQFCNNLEVFNKCGTATYNPVTQFCSASNVYNKCGTAVYDPTSQFCDTRDNQTYTYKKIGSYTWMTQNLNYKPSSGSYCMDDKEANCNTYGRLYTWAVASSSCPSGWVMPSQAQWKDLYAAVGTVAGMWSKSYSNGTNTHGFNGVPTSVYDPNRASQGYIMKTSGFWWTKDVYSSSYYKTFELYSNSVYHGYYRKDSRVGLRCVK